ncbi:MAG: hypothetical protein KC587_16925, partial [Nitrospira sp.]|nr:hypothetical protein [Nitrospira sp.]
ALTLLAARGHSELWCALRNSSSHFRHIVLLGWVLRDRVLQCNTIVQQERSQDGYNIVSVAGQTKKTIS